MLSSIRSRLAAGSKLGLRAFHSSQPRGRDESPAAGTVTTGETQKHPPARDLGGAPAIDADAKETKGTLLSQLSEKKLSKVFEKSTISYAERPGPELSQFTHRFQPKQIYKPSDFDENYRQRTLEVNEKKGKHAKDPFRRFNINPLDEYKNVALLSNYVTEMGRIKPKHMTGLSAKSQRKIAKAIRRARAFGLMPFTYKMSQMLNLGSYTHFKPK